MKTKYFVANVVINVIIVSVLSVVGFLSFGVFSTKEVAGRTAIYRGNGEKPYVSLMFNVYWGTEYVESMLDTLKEYNVKTTFFVGGTWVNENQSVAKRIIDEGHEFGSHGMTHKDHSKLDYNGNYKELDTCHKIVLNLLNYEMKLFAPPSGYYNKNTINVAENLGYKTIMWTRDTIDWRDRDSNIIYSRAINRLSRS